MARGKNEDESHLSDIPHERKEPRPDFSRPPPPTRLPKSIQDTLDSEEKLWESLVEGTAGESTESNVRYAAYASRLRTIMLAAHRYIAYTSDIGESFRPIAHPGLVRSAYAISWAYLGGDVAHEGYKAYVRNQKVLHPHKDTGDTANMSSALVEAGPASATVAPGRVVPIDDYRAVMAQRAVFQGLASMGLPAFTIHSIVRYSGRAMKDVKNVKVRTWGPIGLGLAAVPFLPYVFDKPVEEAVEWTFHNGFKAIGGPSAVHESPAGSRAPEKVPEKEL